MFCFLAYKDLIFFLKSQSAGFNLCVCGSGGGKRELNPSKFRGKIIVEAIWVKIDIGIANIKFPL